MVTQPIQQVFECSLDSASLKGEGKGDSTQHDHKGKTHMCGPRPQPKLH